MAVEEWYSNKELFEMFSATARQMDELREEMVRTTTLIRDYNGLREKIGVLEQEVSSLQGARRTGRDYTGWIFAVVMAIITVLSYVRG
ncbi:hypothetical protein [Desulforamulus reducens]|uniref:hypothetical protein n=1 Tax=Desulforamulus reducens TaxID=59610 RepID=UPI0002E874B2|nr:hypothetical protein [Desulforamulus reducens]